MRRSVAAALVKERLQADALVVTSLGTASRAWREQQPPQLSYEASDPMGIAPSLALGLALAQPGRQVALLEGDGDLSMNLGVLLTIAGARPSNMWIVVFQNSRYETGGGQQLAASDSFDFAAIARGAGLLWAAEAQNEEDAEIYLTELFDRPGPGLLVLRVEPEPAPYAREGPWSQVEQRTMFMQRLMSEAQQRGG